MKTYRLREKPTDVIRENLKAYHPLLQELLHARGITEHADAEVFISPDYNVHIHNPYLLKDMDKVVQRILHALERGERIGIFSDYDADGIPGAVVMADLGKKMGEEK